jgi:tight adherence protein C
VDAPNREQHPVIVAVIGALVVAIGAGLRRAVRGSRAPLGVAANGDVRARHRRHHRAATSLANVVGVIVGVALGGVASTALVVVVAVMIRQTRPITAARRRRRACERALPDALELLVLGIRAGLTPRQAVQELGERGPEPVRAGFALVTHRTGRGQSFADAITVLPEILGPGALALADVMATGDRYGLPLGPVLDQLSIEAREARRRLDQADARRLPVRLSFPLVTCTLASFVLLAIAPAVLAALSSLDATAR